MSRKARGQVRRGQVITTYGPGALIDLPHHSAIVGGLDTWPKPGSPDEIVEPRLSRKLELFTGVPAPRLYAPPPESNDPSAPFRAIVVWRFPEWFVVQEAPGGTGEREGSRRLVHRKALDDKGRFEGRPVVATRFVRTCPRGHVDDLDWRFFVHGPGTDCPRTSELRLDERGTGGDLGDLFVRCACGKSRGLYEATKIEANPLGTCRGARPWLGKGAAESCSHHSRLLIRTASNAWFPQVVSVLSLPDRGTDVEKAVRELWKSLQVVQDVSELAIFRRDPQIAARLAAYSPEEIFAAIRTVREGGDSDRPVKQAELDALLAVPEGYGDDVPVDPDFHARKLPGRVWKRPGATEGIEAVIQVHRLREVMSLVGFTRLEAVMPDIDGEYETEVERAQIAVEPTWFPAVENRGEGLFVQLRSEAVLRWLERPAVRSRIDALAEGHRRWTSERKLQRLFPGGPYVLLHTLSHLLIQSLAMRCGYSASSIRERIYVDPMGRRFGLLLFTGSPDADGTLGGLVQQGRYADRHLAQSLQAGALCSNDPICALHEPGRSIEKRWLHGAACHGCALGSESSCEMRNDYLDRALVVPVIGVREAAYFTSVA